MAKNFRRIFTGIQLVGQNTIPPDTAGEARYNSSTNRLQTFDTALRSITTDDGAQTLTNKTISASLNTFILTGSIVNADINAAAAIARSKMASGPASHVVVNDGSGVLSSEAQLAITRGGTGQSTATAGFNALSPLTTKGDLLSHNNTNNIRVPVGSDTHVFTADSAEVSGVKWAAPAISPSGSLLAFAGSVAPAGYLSCDGSAVNRITYASLFAAIGVIWGVGDGSTTFNVPDLRGRSLINEGTGTGLTARTLGQQAIGAETHAITGSQLPNHTHTGAAHTHDAPLHSHTLAGTGFADLTLDAAAGKIYARLDTGAGFTSTNFASAGGGAEAAIEGSRVHLQGNTGNGGFTATGGANSSLETGNPNSIGTGVAHNIMQPSAVIKWIIKT